MRVDEIQIEEHTLDEVIDLIRGEPGTHVVLEVQRGNTLMPVIITRDVIEVPVVVSTLVDDEIGYIRVLTFESQRTVLQLKAQLQALQDQGMTSLILDLRDNGGGYLTQGLQTADLFLEEGEIAFQRTPELTFRLATATPGGFQGRMAVLVNRYSASASEIVAGALQIHGRATVIGEVTAGKGVGQTLITLADGSEMKVVSYEWLLPDRSSLNAQGIQPDIVLEDALLTPPLTITGSGALPGQKVQIVLDGSVMATVEADAQGGFQYLHVKELPAEDFASEVLTAAHVNPLIDTVLQTAIDVLTPSPL